MDKKGQSFRSLLENAMPLREIPLLIPTGLRAALAAARETAAPLRRALMDNVDEAALHRARMALHFPPEVQARLASARAVLASLAGNPRLQALQQTLRANADRRLSLPTTTTTRNGRNLNLRKNGT